jgi:hypothetical protein
LGGGFFWLLAAVCSALGVLAKYPMVLLPCAVFGYLLFNRRAELKRPGFWVFALGSVVGLIPVFAWNAANGWVTFKHVGTQAAGAGGGGVRWLGPLAFAVGQAGFLIGVWFAVWALAAWRYRKSADPAIGFLWWTSVSVWAVFAVASLKASGQVNWPAAAYVSGFVLCVAWVREGLNGRYHKPVSRLVSAGIAVGLALSALVHFPRCMRSGPGERGRPGRRADRKGNPTPIRKFDPTARLRGWRTLAAEVDAIRARVRAESGAEPLVAGTVWNVPGALGAYCAGHPETYSFGPGDGRPALAVRRVAAESGGRRASVPRADVRVRGGRTAGRHRGLRAGRARQDRGVPRGRRPGGGVVGVGGARVPRLPEGRAAPTTRATKPAERVQHTDGDAVGAATTAGGWVVACGSCDLNWVRAGGLTDYEQQALESRPCPACGAYTLTCTEGRKATARRARGKPPARAEPLRVASDRSECGG